MEINALLKYQTISSQQDQVLFNHPEALLIMVCLLAYSDTYEAHQHYPVPAKALKTVEEELTLLVVK